MCISGWNAGWTGNGNFPYGDGNSGDFGGDFDSVGTLFRKLADYDGKIKVGK